MNSRDTWRRVWAPLAVLSAASMAGYMDQQRRETFDRLDARRETLTAIELREAMKMDLPTPPPAQARVVKTRLAQHPAVAAGLARLEELAELAAVELDAVTAAANPPPGQQVFTARGVSAPRPLLRYVAEIEADDPLLVIDAFSVRAEDSGGVHFEINVQRPYSRGIEDR